MTLGLEHEIVDHATYEKSARHLKARDIRLPQIQELAKQGDSRRFTFPRPMVDRPGLNFSFSGLKTHVLNTLKELKEKQLQKIDQQTRADVACAFEDAVVDTLRIKSLRALEQSNAKVLVVAGGVGANKKLRQQLKDDLVKRGMQVFYPAPEFCTDNAAMVAQLGLLRLQNLSTLGEQDNLQIKVRPRWSLESIS